MKSSSITFTCLCSLLLHTVYSNSAIKDTFYDILNKNKNENDKAGPPIVQNLGYYFSQYTPEFYGFNAGFDIGVVLDLGVGYNWPHYTNE